MESKEIKGVQPGEVHDRAGYPIYPGDLIRTPHYQDRRGKMKYFYHTAVCENEVMWLVPTCHLEPTLAGKKGRCLLFAELAMMCKIISGSGPGVCTDYRNRPRQPLEAIIGE